MPENVAEKQNEKAEQGKGLSAAAWTAISAIVGATLACFSAILVAALNPDLLKIITEARASPTATATAMAIAPKNIEETFTFTPQTPVKTTPSPGKDWQDNCICTQWILYPMPQASTPTEDGCYTQPLPGQLYTTNGQLRILTENKIYTAKEQGIITKIPQASNVSLIVDLNYLENAELWVGIFSEPSLESEGILLVVPPTKDMRPSTPRGSDTKERAFAVRSMPSEARLLLSNVYKNPDGIYKIGLTSSYGAITVTTENDVSEDFVFNHTDRWLFIGYRALIVSSFIDAAFMDLNITEH
jgi:hypothetical protein